MTASKLVKDEASSDSFFARSDNQAFADAGIPAHTLSVGYVFPDYHQAGDEWPKIDYENMAKVDRAVALAVYRIADNAEAPKWNVANPKSVRIAVYTVAPPCPTLVYSAAPTQMQMRTGSRSNVSNPMAGYDRGRVERSWTRGHARALAGRVA